MAKVCQALVQTMSRERVGEVRRMQPLDVGFSLSEPALRASRDLRISRRRSLVYIKGTNSTLLRHVNRKFFYKKWTRKISISLAPYRLAKIINSIFIVISSISVL